MTLEEALEVGECKALAPWRSTSIQNLKHGQTIGVILVEQHGRSYTITATKQGEERAAYNRTVPGWDELCMVVSSPPFMALTTKSWQ